MRSLRRFSVPASKPVDIIPEFIINTGMLPLSDKVIQALTDAARGRLKFSEPLAAYTSYRIGGPATVLAVPQKESELAALLKVAHTTKLPLLVIGKGSNLLVSDYGWDGVAVYLGGNLAGWRFENNKASAMAGTNLLDFIRACCKKGLGGLEKLAGIPGTVGGALKMNAGAFGQEIGRVTETVHGYNVDGSPFSLQGTEIRFGYRQAPGLNDIVLTSSVFQLIDSNPKTLKTAAETTLAKRAARQPLSCPSCGSVFKRPEGHYAGALIEAAGLKGKKIGGAMVSPKHAGFIVNTGKASAMDVYALIRLIEKKIADEFGVALEREVKLVGRFDD